MGLFSIIIDLFASTEKDKNIIKIENDISNAINEYHELFKKYYFVNDVMLEKYRDKYIYLLKYKKNNGKKYKDVKVLLKELEIIFNNLFSVSMKNLNKKDQIIKETYETIKEVEKQSLDEQQLLSIYNDAYSHLVVAGAGCGKTTVIVGKVKWLLLKEIYNPEDILVLSFTNASASEMNERIRNETGKNIDAMTFHKLGKEIIRKVEGKVPKITLLNMKKFINEALYSSINDKKYLNLLMKYLSYYKRGDNEIEGFASSEEYEKMLKSNPPTTYKKEVVKSYGEMDIANFLYRNNIEYIYEDSYKYDTNNELYGQYHPDFYLPKYDIYIEYFGIDRDGNVPDYFTGSEDKSAAQLYNEKIEWKRNLHKENKTVMVECFAYENFEGNLLELLEEKLLMHGVEFEPISSAELWNVINGDDFVMDGIIDLLSTLINLMKSNNYSIQDVKNINNKSKTHKITNNIIIDLLEPIFEKYNEYLIEKNEIDFNDMINLASLYVANGQYKNDYKYVIVDEYQDISKARYQLLNALRKNSDYKLFCVGDDWQSIYRFAGSDINYILDFEKYWGETYFSKIENTYRFSQSLIDVSGTFVMQNPNQIKKRMKGKQLAEFSLGEVVGYNEENAVDSMLKKFEELPENSSVFLIGRYKHDINILDKNDDINYEYNNATGVTDIDFTKRKDLRITFITAHQSKGLQADYVFVINNKNDKMGFPSQIQDSPLVGLLLDTNEHYSFAEERRLFYVVLTRAKVKTFLLTIRGKESAFVTELENRYREELASDRNECPICGGKLYRKNGKYGSFWGCSNYSKTGCKFTKDIIEENKDE